MKVHVTCPSCGDVTTTTEHVLCLDFGGELSFTTRCPDCDALIVKECTLGIYSALVANGAAWSDDFPEKPVRRAHLNHPSNGGAS